MRKLSRRQLGALMMPWGADTGKALPVYAVGSFYLSGKTYPERAMVLRAINAIEDDIPLAKRGMHGWTKRDVKDLEQISRCLHNFLEADYG